MNNTKNSKTFHCVYCNTQHSISDHAEEHVIPKSLLNKNFTLSGTCRIVNNYMAHAFEKRVLQMGAFKELLLLFNPPSKPYYSGQVKTSDDENIHRYILPSGKDILLKHPETTYTNKIEIQVNLENEETVSYLLDLPFEAPEIIRPLPGKEDEFKNNPRKLDQLKKYLQQLAVNPEINPAFEKFLKDHNGSFVFKGLEIYEDVPGYEYELSQPPYQLFELDPEILFKLFLKIAWTYAAKMLDLQWRNNKLAQWILDYLRSGHITNHSLTDKYPDLFTEPIIIGDSGYIFWRYHHEKTTELIESVEDDVLKTQLLTLHSYRVSQLQMAAQLIDYSFVDDLNNDIRNQADQMRHHNLVIRNEYDFNLES